MKNPLLFSFFLCILLLEGVAQETAPMPDLSRRYTVEAIVVEGDTIPMVTLRETHVFSSRQVKSRRYQRKWDKLMRNTVKVYPYAKVAGDLIAEYERDLEQIESESEKNYYIKKAEQGLKEEFEDDIRDMTISQGHVLIKLIDRETGHSSYDLIRELKSGFTAFMWQGIAKIFGTDLKEQYDPAEDETDAMIEEIVLLIEQGEIHVEKRTASTPEANRKLERRKQRMEKQKEREERKERTRG